MKHLILFISMTILFYTGRAQMVPEQEYQMPLLSSPDVKTGTLPNGLKYYILKNQKPEHRMELRLAVNAGSTLEDNDQQGLAHFVEHMAFNGTTHFKKNELVDYLESIGTKFGPHLNAYTSFDETVYMMQVPTDSVPQFNKSFQILEDWAHGLSFDSIEVEKERGVVIEEWRLRQGASERLRAQYWPFLFQASRYEHRLPIGDKNVIEKAPIHTIKQFYKDWYRPNLMAVIAVGDFDVNEVEQKIISHFSKLKNPQKEKPIQQWQVLEAPDITIARARDKEAPYTSVQMVYKLPVLDYKKEADFRTQLMYRLFNGMMASRFDEITAKPNAPFNYAYAGYGELVRYKSNYASFAIVSDQNIVKGVTALIDENERIRRFGFNPSELDRQMKQMHRNLEKQMNELSKTESNRITGQLVSSFLRSRAYLGPAKEMELFIKYMGTISVENINEMARGWLKKLDENCILIIQAPEKPSVKIPDDEVFRKLFREISKREINPYMDMALTEPLVTKKPEPGKIVSEKTDKENGITELRLSNGAKVIYKKTDFKNEEIVFKAFSWGGTSLVNDTNYICASEADGIISNSGMGPYDHSQLNKFLKDKILNIRPFIYGLSEGLSGSTAPQDLETFMQLIYLHFTAPRKDTSGYKSYMEQQRAFIENRMLAPENAYYDTMNCVMSGYHFRSRPWTMKLLNEIDLDCAYDLFRQRFANAGDFTFMFVGNITDDVFKKYCTDYLAALPSTNKTETWKDIGEESPKGQIKRTVKKGVEPKSSVTMMYTGDASYSPKENMDMKVLMKLMNIRLRETLREDNSGTYGVGCYGSLSRIPKQEFGVTITFGCAPENIEKLTKAAQKVLEEVKSSGCEEKNMVKIKETFRRERETNLKENNWWLGVIEQNNSYNDPIPSQKEFDDYFSKLTSDDIRNAAKKYLDDKNYAYFTWVPEGTK